ncbi:GroES-like protein [Polychaeton citri CBS 116435]|uniref:GroES-like protein n=1 Tax=Polychaeton citri CBS 116435 TaxID=1314669 RepID=A0A9P4QD15_9PEZI|nr:GroES-like protein [Polychaeton citri CBS 116435]
MVRVKAAAFNPADWKSIDHGHRVTEWPFVPGIDGSGIVEAVGDKVEKVVVGDEILAIFSPNDRSGSFQEIAITHEMTVAKKPASWSFEEVAGLSVCYFTAVIGLGIGLKTSLPFLKGGPREGFEPSSVLVVGASSALGAATVQVLRLVLPEARILATSSPQHHDHIASLGVDKSFDRNSPSLVEEVKRATEGSKGVEAIIDLVGAGREERYLFETFASDGPQKYAQVWTGEDAIEVPSGVDSTMFKAGDFPELQGSQNIMLSLQNLLAESKYKLPIPIYNLGQGHTGFANGLEMIRKGVSGQKLVANP